MSATKVDEMEFENKVAELTGKRKFWQAFLAAQKKMENVSRDALNPFFTTKDKKAKYATLENVLDEVKPILNGEGICLSQYPGEFATAVDKVEVVTRLVHAETGYVYTVQSIIPVKDPTDPQKLGSAITYGKRYALLAVCGLGTEDDDGNSAAKKPAEKSPIDVLRDKCKASKDDAKKLNECLVEAETLNMPDSFTKPLAQRIKELESK